MNPDELRTRDGYFIDANLLVLLVVGSVGQDLIAKHNRTKQYSPEDYELLLGLLAPVEQIYVTPNTLTETSNLLAQHGEPERSWLFAELRALIEDSREVVVASAQASSNSIFVRLGLTDAALLELVSSEVPLLTVDSILYDAVVRNAPGSAVNFNYHRLL